MSKRLGLAAACALVVSLMIPAPVALSQGLTQADGEPEYRSSTELRAELFELLNPDADPERDTRNVPDQDIPVWSPGDETFTAEATLRHSAAPDLELTVTVQHNAETDYTWTSMNARDVALFLDAYDSSLRTDESGADEAAVDHPLTDSSVIFEIVDHGGTHSWARGLPVEFYEGDDLPIPTRWYSNRADRALVATEPPLGSVDDFWAEGLKRMPAYDESTDEDGTVTRVSVGGSGTDVASAFGSLLFYPRDDAEKVSVTTVSTADGLLQSLTLDVALHNGDSVTSSIRFFDRGEPIETVEIGDVYRSPDDDVGNDISADDYDWSATGASFGPDGESLHEPWTVHGQVRRDVTRRTSLTFTAGDLAILAGRDSISVPDGHEIVRYEYDRRSYMTGLVPDFGPRFPSTPVDPDELYIYELLDVPTRLFPMGLSDEQVWVRLGTVPKLTTLQDWDNDRVTTARIAIRSTGLDGFMEWIESESPDEIFTVTVGSNDTGRVERILIDTLDPDGSSLAFDIAVHPQIDGTIELPAQTAIHLRDSLPDFALEDEALQAFDSTRFDEYFQESRQEYDTIASQRVPRYLTVLAEPVDPPKTGDGEIPTWPNSDIIATGAWAVPGTELIVGCLSTTGAVGRAELTRIWDTFEDGSALDDRLVRTGPGRYSHVTLYASDNYGGQGPCWWEPLPFG